MSSYCHVFVCIACTCLIRLFIFLHLHSVYIIVFIVIKGFRYLFIKQPSANNKYLPSTKLEFVSKNYYNR